MAALIAYTGVAILASSVATSVATKAITGAPGTIASVLSRAGYFSSTAKESYNDYYKMMVSEGVLYDNIMKILSVNADKAYGVRQDPRVHTTGFLDAFATGPQTNEAWISADILCFRNLTSFYDYTAFGRARVRFYYDATSSPGQAVIMCKKKFELEDFRKRLSVSNFDQTTLVFVGVG